MVTQFRGQMAAENNTDGVAALSQQFDKFVKASPDISVTYGATSEFPSHDKNVHKQLAKKDSRSGTLQLRSRKGFHMWTAAQKLTFIVENYDSDTKKYKNCDRQWLLRAGKAYVCFTYCCQKEVSEFLARHGKDSDNFSLASMKPCAGCSQLKSQN